MRVRTYEGQPSGTVDRARGLRRNATDAEKPLWRALREAFPQARFRRQVPVGPYFADVLSFSAKLIVEVDGGQHSEAADYDEARTRFLNSEGYRVLRFWNNEVLQNTDGALRVISESLSFREREGAAQPRKGEGDSLFPRSLSPSPSQALLGPLPLPMGEGCQEK